jgi:hypothetical protein
MAHPHFSQTVQDALGHYVYALVDPRNKGIFYVGKGLHESVFELEDHAVKAQKSGMTNGLKPQESRILEILAQGLDVDYYVFRHGLFDADRYEAADVASTVESVVNDLLTCGLVQGHKLCNIASGHDQSCKGIMHVKEVIALYDHPVLSLLPDTNAVIVRLHQKYAKNLSAQDLYEITRKRWVMNLDRAKNVTHVLGAYFGRVVSVIEVEKVERDVVEPSRVAFEGKLLTASNYLDTSVAPFTKGRNPVTYLDNVEVLSEDVAMQEEQADVLVYVSIARTYEHATTPGAKRSLKDAVRRAWKMDFERAKQVTHVLGVYRNEVVGVLKVTACQQDANGRVVFDGTLDENSCYLGSVNGRLFFGGSVRYADVPQD